MFCVQAGALALIPYKRFNTTTPLFEKMSDYSKKMMNQFGASGVMICLSLARDLGVVDVLIEAKQPLTSQQVADKLNLRERYVREILGALSVGEVINVNDTSTKFYVPEDQKQTLVTVSIFSRLLPQLGMRYNNVKACAQQRNPGGMVYSENPEMFDILKEILVTIKKDIVDTDILPAIPQMAQWLESGIKVAEFGCATGVLVNKLASRFKNSTFLGSDVASKPLEEARAYAYSRGIQNITFSTDNVDTISEKYNESFDWILTRDVIHDLTYPQQALNQIYRCLKPGGIYSMIDIGIEGGIAGNIANGTSMFYYSAGTFMCIPESFRQPDSAALGATWGAPLAREMVAKAGFTIINESTSRTDEKEIHFVCQK
ncbi:S-adenosylmethionine-dependent methyltransferase Rv2258c-like [Haliotis asinina]|uniref:S-adenosylmethionine-dependent methyltransferase Rv2258c-like n=1 Tax=Haliotis asinina TaxID=109174 RepID=UPI003532495D